MHRDLLVQHLENFLEASKIPDHCHNGLQVEGKEEIQTIGTAVSANLQTLEKAVELKLDALLVHHGLFWGGDPYPIVGAKKRKLELLIENGISLFAYHLPLDAHREVGNNWRAAQEMGWGECEPFGEYNGLFIGVHGTITKRPIEEWIKEVESYYGHQAHAALGGGKQVEHVALISGGAYKSLKEAADLGIDCFITGNFDEPAWGVAYEEKIHFLALGHSATEKIGPKAMVTHLQEACGVHACFLDSENPF